MIMVDFGRIIADFRHPEELDKPFFPVDGFAGF